MFLVSSRFSKWGFQISRRRSITLELVRNANSHPHALRN
jgi:hypothetical protein